MEFVLNRLHRVQFFMQFLVQFWCKFLRNFGEIFCATFGAVFIADGHLFHAFISFVGNTDNNERTEFLCFVFFYQIRYSLFLLSPASFLRLIVCVGTYIIDLNVRTYMFVIHIYSSITVIYMNYSHDLFIS